MKKYLISFLVLSFLLILVSPALAAPLNRPPDLLTGAGGVAEQLGTAKGLPEIIALIINILLSLL
ncbi:MAG: hypothetical protein AAB731_00460, partial [Patescibacteria group bacterium]